MPDECGSISMSPDGQYILATGTYKPRVKCFEVSNLSLKFERCFDSEIVAHTVLSDDYSKMVFLSCDRFLEIHAAHGRHYRLRIPRFGYDMAYHAPSCDLFVCGASAEVYRLNLERGQFLQPLQTDTRLAVNVCEVNPEHHLLCVGTQEGTVEAWDPRDKRRAAVLDIAAAGIAKLSQLPAVTALKFKNGLQMGVGTATGHVLVYDIRANRPLVVKDHFNQQRIKRIEFNPSANAVYSMDGAILKMWDETTGAQIAYIESESRFNDFCTIAGTGLMFFAQENAKMLSYYVPHMGPAPRWCSFLDNMTEEIESETVQHIYDDYKFVTKQELESLGLEHLEGTNLLRSYMHGFFVDIRLYNKARAVAEPFAFDRYRKDKIRQQIEAARPARLTIKSNLPKVNQELALKYMEEKESAAAGRNKQKKKDATPNLLDDDRFAAMFANPAYAIDKNAIEYKMLTPVLSRLDKSKVKELKRKATIQASFDVAGMQTESGAASSDEDLFSEREEADDDDAEEDGASSEDDYDDREMSRDIKRQFKQIKKETRRTERDAQRASADADEAMDDAEDDGGEASASSAAGRPTTTMHEMATNDFKVKSMRNRSDRSSLADRVARQQLANGGGSFGAVSSTGGNRQMSFSTKPEAKDARQQEFQARKHREERKRVIRPVTSLRLKKYVSKQ